MAAMVDRQDGEVVMLQNIKLLWRRLLGQGPVDAELIPEDEPTRLRNAFNRQHCPDCGSREFLDGPSGGMSQNIECAECHSRFNIAVFSGTVLFAERIRRQ